MIQVFNTGIIAENGIHTIRELNGRIFKFAAFCKSKSPSIKIELKTFDEETLCNDYITGEITRFYPRNTLFIVEGQYHVEEYVIAGPLTLAITGLGDGEQIDNIRIYYE